MIPYSRENYKTDFELKKDKFEKEFTDIADINYYSSPHVSYRYRAEFSLLKLDKQLAFSMTQNDNKVPIHSFPIASNRIQELMPVLLTFINKYSLLSDKLFQVEFQSARSGEAMITLVYHKKLDENWYALATTISEELNAYIIGRSKKQRLIIGKNFIVENYTYQQNEFSLRLYEQCFCQTNPFICDDMLDWVTKNCVDINQDILELHCGLGTFTIPLSKIYNKLLATENSRPSFEALKENINLNEGTNISIARLSGKEAIEAIKKIRTYRRLSSINLDEFKIKTVFLDPPRAGLDEFTRKNIKNIDNIIYLSCGFDSFKEDLQILKRTHEIKNLALFDQFPHTDHIESGAILKRKAED